MNDLFGNRTDLPPDAEPSDYWYTPRYVLERVESFMGPYFDPCPIDPQQNGLEIAWGADCFINPPYSEKLMNLFIDKAKHEFADTKRFLWLVNFSNSKKTKRLLEIGTSICLPNKRINFIPGHPALGDGKSPRYDSIFILWGYPAGLHDNFNTIGKVY